MILAKTITNHIRDREKHRAGMSFGWNRTHQTAGITDISWAVKDREGKISSGFDLKNTGCKKKADEKIRPPFYSNGSATLQVKLCSRPE